MFLSLLYLSHPYRWGRTSWPACEDHFFLACEDCFLVLDLIATFISTLRKATGLFYVHTSPVPSWRPGLLPLDPVHGDPVDQVLLEDDEEYDHREQRDHRHGEQSAIVIVGVGI